MKENRITVAVFALVGAFVVGALGYFLAPQPHRYQATAQVAMLPPPDLTSAQSSSFWEVLTRGQITRTAAVLYNDPRWLPSAANAAKVPRSELSHTAMALPDTTMLVITVEAGSPTAAEQALLDVLTTATPEVVALSAPFNVKVLWPPAGSGYPVPVPGAKQVAAAGALAGLMLGGGLGWFFLRSRRRRSEAAPHPVAPMDHEALPG